MAQKLPNILELNQRRPKPLQTHLVLRPLVKNRTPLCDELEASRKAFGQPASAPYNDLMQLARRLEKRLEEVKTVIQEDY